MMLWPLEVQDTFTILFLLLISHRWIALISAVLQRLVRQNLLSTMFSGKARFTNLLSIQMSVNNSLP